jgi:drug/metabolite transporter superfamily protein YnfA
MVGELVMTGFLNIMIVGAKIFVALSAIFFVVSMIWAGFKIAKMSDECDAKGGILIKTGVSCYVCVDRRAVK